MEYTADCINCLHKSHIGKACPYCPSPTKDNPNSRCTSYVRADIFVSHTMARMEQAQLNSHGQLMAGLSTIFDLLCEVFPEASERLQEKLRKRQEEAQAEIERAQEAARKEAEEAFQSAKDADEARMQDELVAKYTNPEIDKGASNVVEFPSSKDPNPKDSE